MFFDMRKALVVGASVLKILVGMLFVFSAVSKFVSIDVFEIYVYSFGLFSLTACFYLSRLLIAAELILGAALISHRFHRFTTVTTLLFLLCFVGFLVYAHVIGRTDSCHCFGELVPFNPVQSIMKNAVLILLLLFVWKYTDREWYPRWWLVLTIYVATAALLTLYMIYSLHILDKLALVMMLVMAVVGVLGSMRFYGRWYVVTALVLTPIVTTFILTPPDSWFYRGDREPYDEELFMQQMRGEEVKPVEGSDTTAAEELSVDKLSEMGLERGNHVVAFFSPSCGYCRLAAWKLSTIVSRSGAEAEGVMYVFPKVVDEKSYELFYEMSHSERFTERRIDKEVFVRITRGSFPLILLMRDGDVVSSYSYRNIDEKAIGEFLLSGEEI